MTNKISLIVSREYSTRVKQKTFIVMTILGPILMAALMIVPTIIAKIEDKDIKEVAVIDDSQLYQQNNILKGDKHVKFKFLKNTSIEEEKEKFDKSKYYALLYIPDNVINNASTKSVVMLYSKESTSMGVQRLISSTIEKDLQKLKMKVYKVPQNVFKQLTMGVEVVSYQWKDDGEEKNVNYKLLKGIGLAFGFMIYMFVFMYASQVMRGVIEEKVSRIIEVIISSVKPFQLMMGKIIGVALVGLTQFLLWVVLTMILVTVAQAFLIEDKPFNTNDIVATSIMTQGGGAIVSEGTYEDDGNAKIGKIWDSLKDIPIVSLVVYFLLYFIGGYLLYASLFAAIGAAVDNEADTQQFMMPITIPLITGLIIMMNADPSGPAAYWLSIIPLTSPVAMMIRLPYEVPIHEIILSLSLLFATFVGSTWLAGKIYRTGILMYGKKVTYAELWKWIRYKG